MTKRFVLVLTLVFLVFVLGSPSATAAHMNGCASHAFRICEEPEDVPCYSFYSVVEISPEEIGGYLEGSALADPNLGLAVTIVPSGGNLEVTWYVKVNR